MSPWQHSKPSILARIPNDGHVVIEASAGTGKTYTLEHLVVDLVLKGVPLDKLLVVTFTEKAASELEQRIRQKMFEFLRPPEEEARGEAWLIDNDAKSKLRAAVASFDSATISTIHGFCHRLLREHAFAHGRLFDETLVDGQAAFRSAFIDCLRRDYSTQPTLKPFLKSWLRFESVENLHSLLASVHRHRGQMARPLRLDKLEEITAALQKLPLDPRSLRGELAATGSRTAKEVLDRSAELARLLKTNPDPAELLAGLEELGQKTKGFLGRLVSALSQSPAESFLAAYEVEARNLLEYAVHPQEAVVQLFLPLVQDRLRQTKTRNGQLDFDDMMSLVADSLAGPQGPALEKTLRTRYQHALIDEFQDTDAIQWSIFSRLFLNAPGHRLFVIGDPKQAIYGFRGADVRTYLRATEELVAAGGVQLPLQETFRSGAPLTSAINQILDQNRANPFFTGPIRYDHPVSSGQPHRGQLQQNGHVLDPVLVWKAEPTESSFRSRAARRMVARAIARNCRELLDGKTTVDGRVLTPSDIFVLTRTTREAQEVGEVLAKAGVPHAFYKQDGLFQSEEATDVLWLFAAIAEPEHTGRRHRAWQTPFFAVGWDDLLHAHAMPPEHPLNAKLQEYKAQADAQEWPQLFANLTHESGLVERALFFGGERSLTNYLHIFEILQQELTKNGSTLLQLIHTLTAFIDKRRAPRGEDGNLQRLASEREAVQIMTQHKAKGLEAEVVYLFGGYDKTFARISVFHDPDGQRRLWFGPDAPPESEREQTEEDERLSYVALTRARSRLVLPWFPERDQHTTVLAGLSGAYVPINQALEAVLAEPPDGFEIEVLAESIGSPALHPKKGQQGNWSPAADETPVAVAQPEEILERNKPLIVTSYSRIKNERGGRSTHADEADDRGIEVGARTKPNDSDGLPAGAATGRFLHEVLENVDLADVARAVGPEFWSALPEVRRLLEDGLRRHALPLLALPRAAELVFHALTTPLPSVNGPIAGGLAACDTVVREMEFLYPWPEANHPALGQWSPAPAQRGFIKGFVDVVFAQDGRLYVLDWKSDRLDSYDRQTIDAHVREHYQLQAELYAVAAAKLIGARRPEDLEAHWGGAVYVFLRGVDGTDQGLWFQRPDHDELSRVIDSLAQTESLG